MKKIAKWTAVISVVVFGIAWGIMGFKIADNNYNITVEAYIGLVAFVVFITCILYVKFTNRCPHCKRVRSSFGKYCPHCGKEIN